MEFEENENAITIPNYQNSFIYFLIKKNIVIYVGQTKNGLIRPLSHKDKDFDTIKIIYCDEQDLDLLEDFYIKKYQPICNVNVNYAMNLSLKNARDKIRKMFNNQITIPVIKKIIKELNILTFNSNGIVYISKDDYCKIINYFKERLGN